MPALIASIAYIAAMALALFALVHGLRSSAFGSWFLLLAAYSIAIVMVFVGDPRYHFPLMPFLLMYSALGIINDLPARLSMYRGGRFRFMQDPRIASWLAAMTVFLLLIVVNLWLKTLEGRL